MVVSYETDTEFIFQYTCSFVILNDIAIWFVGFNTVFNTFIYTSHVAELKIIMFIIMYIALWVASLIPILSCQKMTTSCRNKGNGKFVSGAMQEFITIYIIAHGKTLPFDKTPSGWKNKVHKLSLGGVNGNVSTDSRVINTLLFDTARRLGSNRVKQPIEKLYDVREEVFKYFNIKDEIQRQHESQQKFVMSEKSYQKCAGIDCWLPAPFAVAHNHLYIFAANPWTRPHDARVANLSLVREHSSHTEIIERKTFGVWVVDASMRIAKKIGLLPGIQPNVVSLMQLLGILPTTTRSPHDTDDATSTTLFHIVNTIHKTFGPNVSVGVIDISCRYTDWEQMRMSQFKHGFGRSLDRVSSFIRPYLPNSFHRTMRNSALFLMDSRPPRPANPMAIRASDWIVWNERDELGGTVQNQNRITFWTKNGKIQCGEEHDATEEWGLGLDGVPKLYKIGDKIKLQNDRTFTIFHIMPGVPTWFFTHADPEVLEVLEDVGDTGIVDEDDEYVDIDENETKTLYFAVINNQWYITPLPVAPKFPYDLGYTPNAALAPAPLLPPYEYPTSMAVPTRAHRGGGTTRKCAKRKHCTTMKKTHTA